MKISETGDIETTSTKKISDRSFTAWMRSLTRYENTIPYKQAPVQKKTPESNLAGTPTRRKSAQT